MNTEDVISRMYSEANVLPPEQRVAEPSGAEIAASAVESAPMTDLYNERKNVAYEASKRSYPNGARAKMKRELDTALNSVERAYAQAKALSDKLSKSGDITRSSLVREQYMQDSFYPVVEAMVRLNSADELLACSDALRRLDDYVLLEGGSGSGFTRSYVKTLYQNELGSTMSMSDAFIRNEMAELRDIMARGMTRMGVAKAKKLIEKIDSGKHSASNDDYELLTKIASRGK